MAQKIRIVRYGMLPLEEVVFSPWNCRIHPIEQQDAMRAILEELGWVDAVKVSARTGYLLDGHMRVQIAAQDDEDAVPAVWLDLDEEEGHYFGATYDQVGRQAVIDQELFPDLVAMVQTEKDAVRALLATVQRPASSSRPERGNDDRVQVVLMLEPEARDAFSRLIADYPGRSASDKFTSFLMEHEDAG